MAISKQQNCLVVIHNLNYESLSKEIGNGRLTLRLAMGKKMSVSRTSSTTSTSSVEREGEGEERAAERDDDTDSTFATVMSLYIR